VPRSYRPFKRWVENQSERRSEVALRADHDRIGTIIEFGLDIVNNLISML